MSMLYLFLAFHCSVNLFIEVSMARKPVMLNTDKICVMMKIKVCVFSVIFVITCGCDIIC